MSRSLSTVLFHGQFGHGIVQCATDLEHLYRIYSIPTHDKHQWLLLQFIVLLMMDPKGVQNMYSILVVVNKHNAARVISCWFIIYYRLVMHGNSNIKFFIMSVTFNNFLFWWYSLPVSSLCTWVPDTIWHTFSEKKKKKTGPKKKYLQK